VHTFPKSAGGMVAAEDLARGGQQLGPGRGRVQDLDLITESGQPVHGRPSRSNDSVSTRQPSWPGGSAASSAGAAAGPKTSPNADSACGEAASLTSSRGLLASNSRRPASPERS
jgi:hypothetical protein